MTEKWLRRRGQGRERKSAQLKALRQVCMFAVPQNGTLLPQIHPVTYSFIHSFIHSFLFIGERREREKNITVWLPFAHPLLGTWPTTQVCALTGNWTSNPLVQMLAFNPLSHTSWVSYFFITHPQSLRVMHLIIIFNLTIPSQKCEGCDNQQRRQTWTQVIFASM